MASGQYLSVQSGGNITLRADSTLTGSYVASSSLDLGSYTSTEIFLTVGTAQAATTCSLKPQWSEDDTNYFDEQYEVAGTASGTEQPFIPYSRRVDIPISATGNVYCCRFNRMGRYFRVAVKSSGVTTGTVGITGHKQSLSN